MVRLAGRDHAAHLLSTLVLVLASTHSRTNIANTLGARVGTHPSSFLQYLGGEVGLLLQ